MTEAELREAIKTGLSGGYLLYGDEDYLKRFYLSKMRETVLSACPGLEPFNHFKLTLEDMDFSPLREALAAPPVMAEQKFGKGTEEWLMFMDYWNLCQKHWVVEKVDDYWEQLIKDANEFIAKYDTIKLAKNLALALVNTQEQILKEQNGKTK